MTGFDELDELAKMLRWLRGHRDELAKLEAVRDAELARVTAWFDDRAHGDLLEAARLTAAVESWAREHRTDADKSWSTPCGKVSTRVRSGVLAVVNADSFTAWCETNGLMLPPKPAAPDVAAVRKITSPTLLRGGDLLFTEDGEMVPGVHLEGRGDLTVTVEVTS